MHLGKEGKRYLLWQQHQTNKPLGSQERMQLQEKKTGVSVCKVCVEQCKLNKRESAYFGGDREKNWTVWTLWIMQTFCRLCQTLLISHGFFWTVENSCGLFVGFCGSLNFSWTLDIPHGLLSTIQNWFRLFVGFCGLFVISCKLLGSLIDSCGQLKALVDSLWDFVDP